MCTRRGTVRCAIGGAGARHTERVGSSHIRGGDGARVHWHNGAPSGFTAYAAYSRDRRAGVVVLSNVNTREGVDDLGKHLLGQGALLPAGTPAVTPSRPRAEVAIDPRILDAYVGDYQAGTDIRVAMRRRGDHLWVKLGDKGSLQLFPESETVFFLDVVDLTFRFETNPNGNATAVFLGQAGKELRMPRTGAPAAATEPDAAKP